jgi:hypothetical protein
MFTRALALLTALFLAIGVAAAPYAYAQAKKDTAPAPAKTDAKPAATPAPMRRRTSWCRRRSSRRRPIRASRT